MSDLLEVSGLAVRRGRREVLHDVDLDVRRGEVVAVLGPNGAGKSTLLDAVAGVLSPHAGRIRCEGRVASVMQSPGLARRSVRANVELALAWWGVPRRHRRERAAQALQRLRVQHLADRPALSLSGGEKRRVHLARAMAVEADLLLLDEPFVGLDPQAHADLCDDASSALRASTGGVLLVVHDRAEAWAMADRLVVLGEGRIVAEGTPCALLERPPTADVARFLGYDGELHDDHGVLLTRPVHVSVDPGGDIEATLTQVVLREDGARLTLDTGRGIVRAQITGGVSSTRVGDHLRLHIDGGVRFPDQ